MSAVAGLRGTGDWGTDERPKNFREMILWRSPNGTAPIFALMSKVKKEVTSDPEFSWWDEPNDIIRLQVNGAVSDTSATTVVVDSSDPDATHADRNWATAGHLVKGDILLVEPSADVATFDNEYLEVVSTSGDTNIVVKRGQCGSTAATIPNDAYLTKVGSAFAEGTGAPQAVSRNPIKYSNYTQIFKTAYELSGTAEQTTTRTGDPVANDKKRRAFDHSRDIEMALLFGRKTETVGDNGKPKRTMDGIRRFIPASRQTMLSGNVDMTKLLNALYPMFDFDTPAGDTRIGFLGNSALNAINLFIQNSSTTQIQWGSKVTQYGMNFKELVLPQGTILVKTHPLLNRNTLYRNSMFALDFSSIKWRPMKGRDTRMQDNIQNKDEDLRRGQWITEGGLEVDYGGLTNAYVGGITYT